MTREPSRQFPTSTAPSRSDLYDILWQNADFPRLPDDAPAELCDHIVHLDDPRQLYTIHRSVRRHKVQLLIEKFMHQLMTGCDSPNCSTTTCMRFRQKVHGAAPIRRYSPLSARTLAITLASQDNPERFLCPYIQQSNCRSEAIDNLTVSQSQWYQNRGVAAKPGMGRGGSLKVRDISPKRESTPAPQKTQSTSSEAHQDTSKPDPTRNSQPHLVISERDELKDPRSLSAQIFGTVAFRMLEWLTPNSLMAISHKVSMAEQDDIALQEAADVPLPASPSQSRSQSPTRRLSGASSSESLPLSTAPLSRSIPPTLGRRNSNAVIKPQTPKPMLFPPESHTTVNEDISTIPPQTPKLNLSKTARTAQITGSRHASHDDTRFSRSPLESHSMTPPEGTLHLTPTLRATSISATSRLSIEDGDTASSGSSGENDVQSDDSTQHHVAFCLDDDDENDTTEKINKMFAPQSLNHLTLSTIEFIYRTMKDDNTSEKHQFRPARLSRLLPSECHSMHRRGRSKHSKSSYPTKSKQEWALFLKQSIFSCLSQPEALIRSFAPNDGLYPSHSVWWGLAKLLDSQPTLVLHSLWMSASSLFSVPKALQSLNPGSAVFRNTDVELNSKEAGYLMAICLYALVALVPEVQYRDTLLEISRLRSLGLTVTTKSKSTTEMYLQLNDAYSDDLALRLARRLFSAIIARKRYAELVDATSKEDVSDPYMDVLKPLFDQLDQQYLDTQSLHLERTVICLLDWARAVILNDWNGEPAFAVHTAFAGALELMERLYNKRRELLIPDSSFRVDYFADRLDTVSFPISWLNFDESSKQKHLLNYPFLFSSSTLVSFFRAMNFDRMNKQHETANNKYELTRVPINHTPIPNGQLLDFLYYRMGPQLSKYLMLSVRRDNLVEDAMDQLWARREYELTKPLKIKLGQDGGEVGTDLGGVQQEFFQLVIGEIMDPNYGAFTVDSRTHMAWFLPGSLVEDWRFEMIGLIFSLAIFNGTTLPITMPLAFYRKLLGQPVTDIQHIEDGWPDLASGLTQLLDWNESDGLVEDIFARTYEFSVDSFGQPVSREMKADRAEWPRWGTVSVGQESLASQNPEDAPMVTGDNRHAYVQDYIQYLTDVSVSSQFKAFQRGFNLCIPAKGLNILTPTMLQAIVEGVQTIDISALKMATRYVGYSPSDNNIRNFWSVVQQFDEDMKQKLLSFVTASERLPVGGAANVNFVVQKNGVEMGRDARLPTAYTCYQTILLPEYESKEVLQERLCMALQNTQGFGFE